ncbi:MAG: ABC transporter substrate-binding protein [Gammaproteobacteria bacterium]|nr:ABC transporter substrate-binding protein [Gammaproteobacteria bacterium]MDH3560768.1 ABC transporter substrate-binding protein [Gammaproteobacteria bacterium]
MFKRLALIIMLSVIMAMPGLASADSAPIESVRTAVNAIIDILKNQELDKAVKRDRMREIIDSRFDFLAMSQSTLATNWRKASKDEQQQFVKLFGQLIQNTYIGRVEAYTNEEVTYPSEKIKGKRAVVDTLIITSTADIPVSYKLYLKNNQWRVYDVIIEGVSLISNYRSTYQEIVKKEGFASLLARMEAKIEEITNPPS